jgi:hypothetical protein
VRPDSRYIESGGQITCERWVLLTRVVMSPREGETTNLGQQGSWWAWHPVLSWRHRTSRHGRRRGLAPHATVWRDVMPQCRPLRHYWRDGGGVTPNFKDKMGCIILCAPRDQSHIR